MKQIVRDVQTWSVFSDQKGYAFNGYAVSTEDGTVLVDPPDPGEGGWPGNLGRGEFTAPKGRDPWRSHRNCS